MKKIIMMLTLMLGLVVSANAQTELVDNGTVKDNWYVGGGIGTNVWNDITSWTLFGSKSNVNDGVTNSWWRTQPLNVDVFVGKMFTPYVGLEVDYTGIFNVRGESPFLDSHNLTGNVVVNLSNVIAGYHGKRRAVEFEMLGGAGWVHTYTKHFSDGEKTAHNAMSVRGAIRTNFNVGKQWAITVTPEYIWIPKNIGNSDIHQQGVNLSVGVKYRFKSKRGNFPARKLYDYAEVEALKNSVKTLEMTNADLAKANTDLSETIKKLVEDGNKVVIQSNTQNIGSIHFERGSADVTAEAINKVVTAINESKGSIILTGTTSPEGSEGLNKKLAVKRAQSVKNALVKSGVNADRIVIKTDYDKQRSVVITVE